MSEIYLQEIPLSAIDPDPSQPRKLPPLDELAEQVESDNNRAKEILEGIAELATSILAVGLQQPIIVYPAEEADKYVLYDGQRRWMAVSLLHRQGLWCESILCCVRPSPVLGDDVLLGQLSTSLQREELNVFELARSLQKIHSSLKESGGSVRLVREDGSVETVELEAGEPNEVIWEAIERKMGISRPRRYQIQAVLKLPPRIQEIAEHAALPESKLRFLVPIKDEQILETIVYEMVEKGLSNAAIKNEIEELQSRQVEVPSPPIPKPNQIRAAIRPARDLAKNMEAVQNVPAAIGSKDPRTVESYKKVIPELHQTIEELQAALAKLRFLETA